VITETTAIKIASVSGGTIIIGLHDANIFYLVLGLMGLVFSLAAFHYDYEHNGKEKIIWSELIRYMIFGFGALPATYILLEPYIANSVLKIIIGSFVSYYAVVLSETIIERIKTFILEFKK